MLRTRTLLGSAIVLAGVLSAQTAPETGPTPARAVQLPLSGRTGQPGGVATIQNPLPGGLQSVNTITSTVQVQGAYQGSVSIRSRRRTADALSLDDAVTPRASVQPRRQSGYQIRQFGSRRSTCGSIERSNLLPTNISSNLLVTDSQTDLAALGFTGFPASPSVVGPYHYFDLRAGSQPDVFDLTRLKNYRASQESSRAVQLSSRDARDLVVLALPAVICR